MSEFLDGEELTERIRDIMGGSNVKCAVAFWGNHEFVDGHVNPHEWQIICDLSMGATSPEALKNLGAPNNRNLKHIRGLHSKVYISDRGVVIGSANASARALGLDGRAAVLIEAGTFHEGGSDIWRTASDWFAGKFDEAKEVDQDAVDEAHHRYRTPVKEIRRPITEMTALEQIACMPDWYASKGIGFVITTRRTTHEEREEAARQTEHVAPKIQNLDLLNWREGRVFTNWDNFNDLLSSFVEFYLGPRGGYVVDTHFVKIKDAINGHFYTSRPDRPIVTVSGGRFGRTINQNDLKALKKVSERSGGQGAIFTAATFSDALQQAHAEMEGN